MNETIDDLRIWAEKERAQVLVRVQCGTSDLPLRYLRQQAHYTTPASNYALAEKAASHGFAPVEKMLVRYAIATADLSEALEVPLELVEALLASDPHAPLVMIDGEDAQALDDEVVRQGREQAVRVFREANWGSTLRFYRPSGLRLPYCTDDLLTVLTGAGADLPPQAYPIDGIIFPKVEHPEEISWLVNVLERIEQRLALPPNRIKIQFLVESGWAVAHLAELAARSDGRLVGIVFGIADYAADLALPEIRFDHPLCDWARMEVINVAGAVGVPAIDAMTVNYPVTDPSLSPAENRARLLNRLRECFTDALHGIDLGMKGKWVGHPAQLFVVLLAYRSRLATGSMASEIHKIQSYLAAVRGKVGATIIDGVMSDRATDRHARARLREGVALGLLPAADALALGVVTAEEVASLT